ncbi:MAG: Tex-like N-terminal domain-containing protein [Bacilli bacterium]
MNQDHLILVAKDLNIAVTQVAAAAKLLEEGATVPFIARYRKEATGTLDEVQIAKIRDDLERLKAIDDRRDAIKKSLSERNLLSADLEKSLDAADSLARQIYTSPSSPSAELALRQPKKRAGGSCRFYFQQPGSRFLRKGVGICVG